MRVQPDYFEKIRQLAASRWNQLESDPELAGPWHQLFKQVQSPRHVLSELLQNADDANATEATVELDGNGVFTFSHNGDDFIEEHFRSLCRFGYSNKRELHTIGFRGVGFKSVFSLGECVELVTPTLSVQFFQKRFTEPRWHDSNNNETGNTRISVEIQDRHRLKEIEKNLEEWKKSPVSLLFFKTIRSLKITGTEISWHFDGVGPVNNSEWMVLNGQEDRSLLVWSEEEPFPPEALSEIAQERLVLDQDKLDFPPSRVDLVLGTKGRLFVVLPTGVETQLPFAINAPFIQDPARLKIKDPETSPTNRWLLKRSGDLAAETLVSWLQSDTQTIQEKVEAYKLFPDVNRNDESLEGTCGTEVELAFENAIAIKKILLTEEGSLTEANGAVIVPRALTEVWPSRRCTDFFDAQKRPPLCQYVSAASRKKLSNWNLVESISQDVVTTVMVKNHLPKPESWEKLLKLWTYISPKIDRRAWVTNPQVRIFPVNGSDALYGAEEVVRLKSNKILRSDEDWQFLSMYLSAIDLDWLQFIDKYKQNSEEAAKAIDILEAFSLSDGNDNDELIEQVARAFFSKENVELIDCVRLAQIAAALDVEVGESFGYVSNSLDVKDRVLIDPNGVLGTIVDPEWLEENLLHTEYQKSFTSCSRVEWNDWVRSGKSGLLQMLPLMRSEKRIYGRDRIQEELQTRGSGRFRGFPYVTQDFVVQDWDFEYRHWQYWKMLSETDPNLWFTLSKQIFIESEKLIEEHSSASVLQVATTGSRQKLYLSPDPLPSWILKLRNLPCLKDTYGKARRPDELLRRTQATEPLLDVELFVDKQFDIEKNAALLDLLGVGTTPTGPTKILVNLRSLAMSPIPPISEVEKWYGRLDILLDHCSTEDADEIRGAFASEKLIFTENGIWETSTGVFLNADEQDAPGAEIIRSSVRNLMLWTKIGVANRPSLELALNWLKTLPSGKPLTKEEVRRVQNLLATHPIRVWEDCEHWMNLNSEWVSVDNLSYFVSMQSLVKYSHLFPNIKQRTADLQKLSSETVNGAPFNRLVRLAEVIEKRFYKTSSHNGRSEVKPWLTQLGRDISRIKLEDKNEQTRIRALGNRLSNTKWKIEKKIQVVPYINGVPAGEPSEEDVAWIGDVIYVKDQPTGKIARAVSNELCKAFRIQELEDAIKLCLERDVEFVSQYMDENFELDSSGLDDKSLHDHDNFSKPNNDGFASKEESRADDVSDDFSINGGGSNESHREGEEYDSDSDDDESEYYDYDDEHEETSERTRSKRPPRRNLIDRFAEQNGFRKDSDDRFFHTNGSWISKNKDKIGFQWEHRRANGSLVKFYHVRDHCLEKKPLEVDTDVFGLLRNYPERYSLILADSKDAPIELTGERVDEMRRDGELSLLPATYRIVKIR